MELLDKSKRIKGKKFNRFPKDRRTIGIISNLSKLVQIPINKNKITRDLLNHPDYPSLLATSDVLLEHGVKNEGVMLTRDYLKEQTFPIICVLFIEENESVSVIVTNVNEETIEYLDPVHGYITEDLNFFFEKWKGHALLIDPVRDDATRVTEKNQAVSFYRLMTYLAPAIIGLTTITGFIVQGRVEGVIFSILYSLGIYLSILLLQEELNSNEIPSICSKHYMNGCVTALQSKLSSVFVYLNLSEIGFAYYFSIAMLLCFNSLLMSDLGTTYLLINATSLVGLVFSLYSFYYQFKILKAWCLLCNLVGVVNGLLFGYSWVLLMDSFTSLPLLNFYFLGLWGAFFIVFISVSAITRQWINLSSKSQGLEGMMNYLDKSEWLYDVLKMNSRREAHPIQLNELVFGAINSHNVIRLVLNPHSWMCKEIYTSVKEAHENNKIKDYRVEFRMVTRTAGSFNQSMLDKLIQKRFIFTANQSMDDMKKVYDACYSSEMWGSPQKWMEIDQDIDSMYDFIESQVDKLTEWIEENSITQTPTLIIDGYIIPTIFIKSYVKRIVSV